MTGADREYCRSCAYFGRAGSGATICEYSLVTGKCRSTICPAGVGCTCHSKFEHKRRKRHKRMSVMNAIDTAASIGVSRSEYKKIDKAAALKLHKEGKNDGEIARAFGCTPAAVRFWRKSYGLPPNCAPGNPSFKKEEELQ